MWVGGVWVCGCGCTRLRFRCAAPCAAAVSLGKEQLLYVAQCAAVSRDTAAHGAAPFGFGRGALFFLV